MEAIFEAVETVIDKSGKFGDIFFKSTAFGRFFKSMAFGHFYVDGLRPYF